MDLGEWEALAGMPSDNGLQSPELFTDRESQLSSFATALRVHSHRLGDMGTGTSRRNIVSFYGRGGVGKSALSRRLEGWLNGEVPVGTNWSPSPTGLRISTARIDLHQSGGGVEIVGALVEIRTALHSHRRSWPAFDLALASYWQATRPNEPLPESRNRSRNFASATQDLISDLAADLGALSLMTGTGIGLLRTIARRIGRSAKLRAATGNFDEFEDFLERCIDIPNPAEPHQEIAVSIAAQLTFAIHAMKPTDRPLLVVFVDTFERLTADPRRSGECLLNQLVYSMPYTLFVVTGREPVDWYRSRPELYRSGPQVWPNLREDQPADSCQHALGGLSDRDARGLLQRIRRNEYLPIDDMTIDQIVADSCGLPLYLELAVELARSAFHNGETSLSADQVAGSLGTLVVRLLDDIPPDEQDALRAACLLPFFDSGLAAAGAAVPNGAAERMTRRPLVRRDGADLYPFRVHDEVRLAVRAQSDSFPGAWSSRDWEGCGQRMLEAIGARHETASAQLDPKRTQQAVVLALYVIAATGLRAEWFEAALTSAPSFGGVATQMPRVASTTDGQRILDFVAAKANLDGPNLGTETLGRLADSPGALGDVARRHYAYRLRDIGEFRRAIAELDKLIEHSGSQGDLYSRSNVLAQARQFAEALAAGAKLDEHFRSRLESNVLRYHGDLEPYLALASEEIARFTRQRDQRSLREYKSAHLRVLAWTDGTIGDQVSEELDLCESVGHVIGAKNAMTAAAILKAGDADEVWRITERLRARESRSTASEVSSRVAEPRALDAFVRSDYAAAEHVQRFLAANLAMRTAGWIGTECLLDHMGFALQPPPESPQWTTTYETVKQQWVSMASNVRARQS